MSNEDQIYNLIENYLNGQLSGQELLAFKKELDQNQELYKKVESHRLANEMVIEYRLQNVKSILHQEKINYSKTNLWKKIISGIFGGLLVASLLFFLVDKDNSDNDQITPSNKSQNTLQHQDVTADHQENIEKNITKKNTFNDSPIKEINQEENKDIIFNDSAFKAHHEVIESEGLNNPIPKVNDEPKPITHKQSKNACEEIDISYHISLKPSCEGDNNGSIIVSAFKGGTSPYHYFVSQNNNEFTPSNLSAGTYTVVIKDSKGCLKNIPDIEILEKHCQKDYSFNPSIGESWEIPTYKNSGTLILYDEGGNVYFTEEISAGEKQQWAGQSKNGEVKTGYFLFVINYKDGTSKHGSVTIVR